MTTLSVPIDATLIGEIFLRVGAPNANVGDWVENSLRDYLDRTAVDEWSPIYSAWREQTVSSEYFAAEFGDAKGGYRWGQLLLPNGTLIRMDYKHRTFQAAVKFDRINYEGQNYSPSELAKKIAAGTNRNAWRDLWIKRPDDAQWWLADDFRKKKT